MDTHTDAHTWMHKQTYAHGCTHTEAYTQT